MAPLNGLTDHIKTDEGYHLVRYAVVGEVDVVRRDDLRGIWEVTDGNGIMRLYPDREAAFLGAEHALDAMTEEAPSEEPEPPEPEQPTGTMIG